MLESPFIPFTDLCLQIDIAPKSCIQLDLQPLHFLSDHTKLLLERCDFLFDLLCRAREHLLDFGERQRDERVANLVSEVYSWQMLLFVRVAEYCGLTVSLLRRLLAPARSRRRRGPLSLSAGLHVRHCQSWLLTGIRYMFRFQLFLQRDLPLMEAAEPVDFVLILSSDFDLFTASRDLILLRQLLLSCALAALRVPDLLLEGKLTYHTTLHHEFKNIVISLTSFNALQKFAREANSCGCLRPQL